MLFYGTIEFITGQFLAAIVNTSLGAILLVALILSRTVLEGKRVQLYTVVIAITFVYVFFLLIDNSGESTNAFWMFVYPISTLYLLGRRRSMPWIISFIALLTIYLFVSLPLIPEFPLNLSGKIRFLGSLLIVTSVAYTFVWIRDRLSHELESQNFDLHREKEKLIEAMRLAELANEAKSDFLANMSHELRTPLNHIIGFTQLITDEKVGNLNEAQKEYLDDVLQSSNHLLSLINDILDLSKVEAGKMELSMVAVNVENMISESIKMLSDKAALRRITISAVNENAPRSIAADERKLKQIVSNLISNAVKFSNPGGEIVVRYGSGKGGEGQSSIAYISVQDYGIGIDKKDFQSIFNPFIQVDGSTDRQYQGTGLGLALTKQLVELHDGTISVESSGPGKGSVFTVTLPLTEELTSS
jgi:signal transduction histidine kinase